LDWHLLVPLRHAVKRLRNPILVDVDGLSYIPLRLGFYVPKGVLRTAHILQSIRYYAGFFELFVAWLLISIVPPTANVSLDLSDFIGEGEDPLGQLQSTLEALREEAVLKLDAYNRAFSLLAQRDPALADTAKKDRITRSLREAAEETDRFRKGRLLEKALTELFESDDSFRIARTNLNNEDEELDIVIHNNSTRPFLISLSSPIILLECKNWRRSIGSPEVRDFEGKLRNHSNLCRLGLLVSLNGFSKDCDTFLKRMGRGDQVVVPISGDDISEYLSGTDALEDWVQDKISKSVT